LFNLILRNNRKYLSTNINNIISKNINCNDIKNIENRYNNLCSIINNEDCLNLILNKETKNKFNELLYEAKNHTIKVSDIDIKDIL